MEVLVDFNNVLRADRARGLVFVVDKIITALGFTHIGSETHLLFRLYDGWYQNRTPTRIAQNVSTELLAAFPLTRTLSNATTSKTVIVNAELAYSLKTDPATHLWHTFRQRGFPAGLGCHLPSSVGCTQANCSLSPMHALLTASRCPAPTCKVLAEQLIYKSEQKLVDTMLAADLIYLCLQRDRKVAVVSSDDDMWPAIKTVLNLGMTVLHVHTSAGRRTPQFYTRGGLPTYVEMNI